MAEKPFAHESEEVFARYLDRVGLSYEREVSVDPGNVDFLVRVGASEVFCDVKAVEAVPEMNGLVDAQYAIRNDLKVLKRKFLKDPTRPCVLVTMNYSPQLITGYTIRIAMLGDVGVNFSFFDDRVESSPLGHLPRGNAVLRRNHYTSLSGILMIDCRFGEHTYFANPYAAFPLPAGFFPEVNEIKVQWVDGEEEFIHETNLMFFPRRQC